MAADPTDVILGPSYDLHVGIKGAFMDAPPSQVRYRVSDAHHTFLFPDERRTFPSPFLMPHWGEFVAFMGEADLVHSAHWPVLNRGAWVVETDDFGYPLLGGRYALNPKFASQFSSSTWAADFRRHLRSRLQNMVQAYAHPSCRAVLCRCEAAARAVHHWVRDLGANSRDSEEFLRKIQVVAPGVAPGADEESIRRKWFGTVPMQVVFCGRDFQTKNGVLALQVFCHLAPDYPDVRWAYIGKIPDAFSRGAFAHGLRGIRHFPDLERRQVLELLRDSHVLFHPSRFESIGIVLIEAASMGLAVVTASGPGMAHTPSLLEEGALFVDRSVVSATEESGMFISHLRTLLSTRRLAMEMGLSNYASCVGGALSVGRRNGALEGIYDTALSSRQDPLTASALPHRGGCRAVCLPTRDLTGACEDAVKTFGLADERIAIESRAT